MNNYSKTTRKSVFYVISYSLKRPRRSWIFLLKPSLIKCNRLTLVNHEMLHMTLWVFNLVLSYSNLFSLCLDYQFHYKSSLFVKKTYIIFCTCDYTITCERSIGSVKSPKRAEDVAKWGKKCSSRLSLRCIKIIHNINDILRWCNSI